MTKNILCDILMKLRDQYFSISPNSTEKGRNWYNERCDPYSNIKFFTCVWEFSNGYYHCVRIFPRCNQYLKRESSDQFNEQKTNMIHGYNKETFSVLILKWIRIDINRV